MGDSLITIIAIFLAAILMFVFPLMAVSERTDDISQLAVETSTTEFVDNVRNTGKLTLDNYSKFIDEILIQWRIFQFYRLPHHLKTRLTRFHIGKIFQIALSTDFTQQKQ